MTNSLATEFHHGCTNPDGATPDATFTFTDPSGAVCFAGLDLRDHDCGGIGARHHR